MPNTEKLRLTGGIFFALLLRAKKQRTGLRKIYNGDSDGLSEPDILCGLAKIIQPDFKIPMKGKKGTLSTDTSGYKSCKANGGSYFPFENESAKTAFDNRIKHEYADVLAKMAEFVDRFIDAAGDFKADVDFVKALIALIDVDDSIADGQEFYILPDGHTKTKSKLVLLDDVCLPSFLLGVWHFAALRKEGNQYGRQTYETLFPAKNAHNTRDCAVRLEDLITRDIHLTYSYESAPPSEYEEIPPYFDSEEIPDENKKAAPNEEAAQDLHIPQMPFIQQNMIGNGGKQIGYIHSLHIDKW